MPTLRMILSLAFMVPTWAILGAFAHLDAFGRRAVIGGAIVGGIVGVFFGLGFGGVKGKWVDWLFGPEVPEE
jgi:hypothetical protein